MAIAEEITFEEFEEQWLEDVTEGQPSTVELGRRFAHKLLTQWLDIDRSSDDLIYCDGSGDGGIDVAHLDRGDTGADESDAVAGDTWYIVQSKFGSAFQGVNTLLEEGQKVIDTLDGKRQKLSSLAEGLLERLLNFRSQASDSDRVVLVFATLETLAETQDRALQDIKAIGRERLGPLFDVQSVSVETIYRRTLEQAVSGPKKVRVRLQANMVQSSNDLMVGTVTLTNLARLLPKAKPASPIHPAP